ncbi:uncharacterized protein METZ01_LOCUS286898, partial [marine metagenome]
RDIAQSSGQAQVWNLSDAVLFPGTVEMIEYLPFTYAVPQFDNEALAMCNFVERRYGSSEDPDSTWDNYKFSYVGMDTIRYLGEYESVLGIFQQNLILPIPLPILYGNSLSVSTEIFGMSLNIEYSVDRWGDIINDDPVTVMGYSVFNTMVLPDSSISASEALTFLDEDYLPAAQIMVSLTPAEEGEGPPEIDNIFMVLHDYQDILRGCTDFTAINYNSNAEIDEGCWYMDIVEMDSSLVTEPLNFSTGSGDIELTIDAGTIIYMNDSSASGSIEIYIIETPVWAWNGDLLPDSTEFARDIVTFYPIDLSFSEPVDISLSYSSTGNNFRLMMLEDSEDDSWEEVEGAVCSLDEFGESICEASVSSFGIFGVQEIPLSTFMENIMPETFTLHQNYPNPFNPITNL